MLYRPCACMLLGIRTVLFGLCAGKNPWSGKCGDWLVIHSFIHSFMLSVSLVPFKPPLLRSLSGGLTMKNTTQSNANRTHRFRSCLCASSSACAPTTTMLQISTIVRGWFFCLHAGFIFVFLFSCVPLTQSRSSSNSTHQYARAYTSDLDNDEEFSLDVIDDWEAEV